MTPEEYIAQYGAHLTESEKRYIMAFGAPTVAIPGASRRPETPALLNALRGNVTYSASEADAARVEAEAREHAATMERMDNEAAEFGSYE